MSGIFPLLIIIVLFAKTCTSQSSKCKGLTNCGDCIKNVDCVWCIKPSNGINCISKHVQHTCTNKFDIINPPKHFQILQNDDFRSGPTPIQIKPQKMKLSLRKDDWHKINFQFKTAKNYPVDLYYLMDVSASMHKHKEALAKLGSKLSETMKKNTNDFRIGFGSFIDKPTSPYIHLKPDRINNPCNVQNECVKAYSFIHQMSLSKDDEEFSNKVRATKHSGNIDAPEGGFDALMQVMVCDDTIGWRNNSRHLVVFSTDSYYHVAGDGKLGGVVEPNDGKCHMKNDEYTDSLIYDYPSVSHINYVAKKRNFNLFFAIDKSSSYIYHMYRKLAAVIENSEIGDIRTDIDMLIDKFYRNLVQTVEFKVEAPNFVEIKFSGDCGNSNKCTKVSYDNSLNLMLDIKVTQCVNTTRTIKIKPGALNEALEIELDTLCNCPCEKSGDINFVSQSPKCSRRGDLQCGVCVCNKGYVGKNCECDENDSSKITDDDANCRLDNSSQVCSGRGTCKCGTCVCKEREPPKEITGKYCDCDNFSCDKNKGVLCSGPTQGNCVCGICECLPGWTGDSCDCKNTIETCTSKEVTETCSGNGDCVCGVCQCKIDENRYSGRYCEESINEPGKKCQQLFPCVRCKAFAEGDYNNEECVSKCAHLNVTIVDNLEEEEGAKICRLADYGCTIYFQYFIDDDSIVKVQKEKVCSVIGNVYALIGIVAGSILLAGLLLLLLWKLITTVHDRHEYAKFENEQKKAKWSKQDNPLYKGAVTKFNNPTFGE